MRCMVCGSDMDVVEAVPDLAMAVGGYERHALRCAECGETEQRLVFRAGSSQPSARTAAPDTPMARSGGEATTVEDATSVPSAPAAGLQAATSPSAPLGAWARAIKKLHDQQEVLRERAKLAVAARESQQFTDDWAAGFRPRAPEIRRARPGEIARRMRFAKLNMETSLASGSRKWAKVVATVGGKRGALGQVPVIAPAQARDDAFDRMWEGLDLAPAAVEPPATEPVPSITPPSQSTSLVPIVDESAGLWARAVAMLDGTGLHKRET